MKSKHVTLWLAVAVLAVFAMAASSPQCARTNDLSVNPTGSSLAPLGTYSQCVQGCSDIFTKAQKAEQARYKAANTACNGDAACKALESAIHSSIMAELVADKDACKLDCAHQQGAATSGQ